MEEEEDSEVPKLELGATDVESVLMLEEDGVSLGVQLDGDEEDNVDGVVLLCESELVDSELENELEIGGGELLSLCCAVEEVWEGDAVGRSEIG